MLKQGLELKQQQKLSPLQIQTIKLIELPIQELEQRIRKELEENPVLDEEQPAEKDEEKAAEWMNRFEKVAKTHPYPNDIVGERELVERAIE